MKQQPVTKNKFVLSSDKQDKASNVKQLMATNKGAEKRDCL
jgi:hypothetical protein